MPRINVDEIMFAKFEGVSAFYEDRFQKVSSQIKSQCMALGLYVWFLRKAQDRYVDTFGSKGVSLDLLNSFNFPINELVELGAIRIYEDTAKAINEDELFAWLLDKKQQGINAARQKRKLKDKRENQRLRQQRYRARKKAEKLADQSTNNQVSETHALRNFVTHEYASGHALRNGDSPSQMALHDSPQQLEKSNENNNLTHHSSQRYLLNHSLNINNFSNSNFKYVAAAANSTDSVSIVEKTENDYLIKESKEKKENKEINQESESLNQSTVETNLVSNLNEKLVTTTTATQQQAGKKINKYNQEIIDNFGSRFTDSEGFCQVLSDLAFDEKRDKSLFRLVRMHSSLIKNHFGDVTGFSAFIQTKFGAEAIKKIVKEKNSEDEEIAKKININKINGYIAQSIKKEIGLVNE